MALKSRAEGLPDAVGDSTTGATTNEYTNCLDWACWGFIHKTIILKNTHSSRALKYKVLMYAYPGDEAPYEFVSETSLSASGIDTARIVSNYVYAEIKVQVKSSVTDTPATYQCDYTGGK